MIGQTTELELPLGDRPAGELARHRLRHLGQLVGGDQAAVLRLASAFRSLASIYAASEPELAQVVGPIVAARMRWFLDAPLIASVVTDPTGGLSEAA